MRRSHQKRPRKKIDLAENKRNNLNVICGRNAVLDGLKSGNITAVFVLEGFGKMQRLLK